MSDEERAREILRKVAFDDRDLAFVIFQPSLPSARRSERRAQRLRRGFGLIIRSRPGLLYVGGSLMPSAPKQQRIRKNDPMVL